MNGIKMSDCKFYIDAEARTVVCVIPNTEDLLNNFIEEQLRWNDIDIYYSINYHLAHRLHMPYSFKGKAVCSKNDTWNEELGKMIAFSRAKDKCYKSFFKRANTLVQTLDARLGDMITIFNDFGAKLEAKRLNLETKIEERTQKE